MGSGNAKPRLTGRGFVDTAFVDTEIDTLYNHNPVLSKKQALGTWEVGLRPSSLTSLLGHGPLLAGENV